MAGPSHLLAIDQGTTSSRAMVFDRAGRSLGQAQKELTQHFPKPGWVEHRAEDLWADSRAVAEGALADAGIAAGDVAAIGITNQRETTLLWDRESGEALHPAIVWQDRRTAELCDDLKSDGHEPGVQAKSGLLLDPYFFGQQARLAARQSARRPGPGRARQARLRHGRLFPSLAADRGPGARNGRDQRGPHLAVRHPCPGLGRSALGAVPDPAGRCCRRCATATRSSGPRRPASSVVPCRSPASPGTSKPPASARPASRLG